ncbi:MAG: hypothetical protein ACK4NC_01355 [Candidatus Gracilibacteria bacterium]
MNSNLELPNTSIEDQVSLTHSYFLLGMLFEKVRNEPIYTQVHPLFLLHTAYTLQKEYSEAPEILNIWKYLVGINIPQLKELKKIQELFCIIAAMQDISQSDGHITAKFLEKYFANYLGKNISKIQNISVSLKKETHEVVLSKIIFEINNLVSSQKVLQKYPLIVRLISNAAISVNGLLPYPYLNIDFSEDQELVGISNKSVTKALEKCMREFDQLKNMHSMHLKRIATLGRVSGSAEKLYTYLLKKPVVTTKDVQSILGIAKPNALLMIDRFIEIGILCQMSTGERNRIYGHYDLLKIFDLNQIK